MKETLEEQVLRVMKEMILSGEMNYKIVDGEPLFSLPDSLPSSLSSHRDELPLSSDPLPHLQVVLDDWQE